MKTQPNNYTTCPEHSTPYTVPYKPEAFRVRLNNAHAKMLRDYLDFVLKNTPTCVLDDPDTLDVVEILVPLHKGAFSSLELSGVGFDTDLTLRLDDADSVWVGNEEAEDLGTRFFWNTLG